MQGGSLALSAARRSVQAGRLARVLGRGADAASDSNRIIDAYLDGSRYDVASRNTTTETGQRAADKAALPATTITGRAAGRIDDAAPNSGVGGARQIAGDVKDLINLFIKDESGSVKNPFVRQNAGNGVGNGGNSVPSFTTNGSGTHLIRNTTVDGTDIQINSGHAYNRPHSGGDVSHIGGMDEIETAILNDISSNSRLDNLSGFGNQHTIKVNGQTVIYELSDTPIGPVISNYYPPNL